MKRAKYKRYITAVVLFVILAIILTPLLMDAFVYLVFNVWLAVPLPAGLLTFL